MLRCLVEEGHMVPTEDQLTTLHCSPAGISSVFIMYIIIPIHEILIADYFTLPIPHACNLLVLFDVYTYFYIYIVLYNRLAEM